MTALAADYRARTMLSSSSPGSSDAYKLLLSEFEQAKNRGLATASTLQSRAAAVLARIAFEYAEAGWDGYRSKPIRRAACERAQSFIDALPCWMPSPDIVPEADGEISIEWDLAPDRIFSISIGAEGPLHFAGIFGRNKERHGVEPFDEAVPEEIFNYINQILRTPARRAA